MLASCADTNDTAPVTSSAVVEAYLKAGAPFAVKIRTLIPYDENLKAATLRFDTLRPVIIASDGQSYALRYQGDSVFVSHDTMLVKAGLSYRLQFNLNGKLVIGNTLVPSYPTGFRLSASSLTIPDLSNFTPGSGAFPTFPDPISVTWTSPSDDYYLVVVECIEANPTRILDGSIERPSFRSEPVKANGVEISFPQFTYYGRHRVVLIRTTPEYAALYSNNSTSSLSIVSATSSIENALGVFTGFSSDTLYLQVQK